MVEGTGAKDFHYCSELRVSLQGRTVELQLLRHHADDVIGVATPLTAGFVAAAACLRFFGAMPAANVSAFESSYRLGSSFAAFVGSCLGAFRRGCENALWGLLRRRVYQRSRDSSWNETISGCEKQHAANSAGQQVPRACPERR